jgi:hypothetical protein
MDVLKVMEKKGWWLLSAMVLVSFLWKDVRITLGVVVGGVIAMADLWFLRVFFSRLVLNRKGAFLLFVQIFKYLFIAVFLGGLLFYGVVDPIATLVGLSLLAISPILRLSGIERELKEVS